MEALCSLVIACVAELWPMLPKHKSKRFREFHAKPDGVRWADMIDTQLIGYPPSNGPRYHHESVTRGCDIMTDDNLCVFHFEGNRGQAVYNKTLGYYLAEPWGPWGNITVVITNDLKLKTSFRRNYPRFGIKEVDQEVIDAEIADLMVVVNEWFLTVLRKVYQLRTREMKEELVAKVWAPERVATWLEAGVALEAL
jgi:hypothetical protein